MWEQQSASVPNEAIFVWMGSKAPKFVKAINAPHKIEI